MLSPSPQSSPLALLASLNRSGSLAATAAECALTSDEVRAVVATLESVVGHSLIHTSNDTCTLTDRARSLLPEAPAPSRDQDVRLRASTNLQAWIGPHLATLFTRWSTTLSFSRDLHDTQDASLVLGEGLPPEGWQFEDVYRGVHAVVLRRDHAGLREGQLTRRAYVDARHLRLDDRGTQWSTLDAQLAARGLARRSALSAAACIDLADLLRKGDLLATVPEGFALQMARESMDLTVVALPAEPIPARYTLSWQDTDTDATVAREVARFLAQALAQDTAAFC